jgi:hypothetical protein
LHHHAAGDAPLLAGQPGRDRAGERGGLLSAATTGNQFRYRNGQYLYNWSTKCLAPGAYLLRIDLGDGAQHTVTVGLR